MLPGAAQSVMCFPETPKTQSRDLKSLFLKEIFHEMRSAYSKSLDFAIRLPGYHNAATEYATNAELVT